MDESQRMAAVKEMIYFPGEALRMTMTEEIILVSDLMINEFC